MIIDRSIRRQEFGYEKIGIGIGISILIFIIIGFAVIFTGNGGSEQTGESFVYEQEYNVDLENYTYEEVTLKYTNNINFERVKDLAIYLTDKVEEDWTAYLRKENERRILDVKTEFTRQQDIPLEVSSDLELTSREAGLDIFDGERFYVRIMSKNGEVLETYTYEL